MRHDPARFVHASACRNNTTVSVRRERQIRPRRRALKGPMHHIKFDMNLRIDRPQTRSHASSEPWYRGRTHWPNPIFEVRLERGEPQSQLLLRCTPRPPRVLDTIEVCKCRVDDNRETGVPRADATSPSCR